jgi:hypothetical protein
VIRLRLEYESVCLEVQAVIKSALILLVAWSLAACFGFAAECDPPAEKVDISIWSTQSLASPDGRWRFTAVGTRSAGRKAPLYVQDTRTFKRWKVGVIERDGIVFWSEDNRRIFLEDLYAADDTHIRVFDLTGPTPREIKGLNETIRKEIDIHIPKDESPFWLVYPETCFAADDSSVIIVVAHAPHVPEKAGVPAKPLRIKMTVNVVNLQILESVPQVPKGDSSSARRN